MTESIAARITALRDVAPQLNASIGDVNATVQELEKFFDGIGLGLSAISNPFKTEYWNSSEDDGVHEVTSFLAYGRINGQFRFYILQADIPKGEDNQLAVGPTEKTAWPQATREDRMIAFAKMPQLLDRLIEHGERLLKLAKGSTDTVKAILDGLYPDRTS